MSSGEEGGARECPRCRHGWQHGRRNVLIQPERGSWSGEWLWRCDCCKRTYYERDFQ